MDFTDPWEEYESARATAKEEPAAPYLSLLSLLEEVAPRPGDGTRSRFRITHDGERAVAKWCSRHGLLGLLQQRMLMMAYRPRWAPPPGSSGSAGVEVATQKRFVAEVDGWFPLTSIDRSRQRPRGRARSCGVFLEPGEAPADWPGAGVLIRPFDAPSWRWEPYSVTFARHFPDLAGEFPDEVDYPQPLSEAFCKNYCEPLDEFLAAAIRLNSIWETLGLKTPVESKGTETNDRDREIAGAIARLHALTGTVSTALVPLHDGNYRRYTVAASLIASYAYMILQDLADPKRRVLRCPVCEKTFTSTAYQAVHCSRTCQRTAHRRRWRARKKDEEAADAAKKAKSSPVRRNAKTRTTRR